VDDYARGKAEFGDQGMKEKFMTVVFQILDKDGFSNVSRELSSCLASEDEYYGAKVVSCSHYDEISRVERLEQILEDENLGYLIPSYEVKK